MKSVDATDARGEGEVASEWSAIERGLRLHVDRLAGLIGPRYLKKPPTMDATAGYIQKYWEGIGYEVVAEDFEAIGIPTKNLLVEQAGKGQGEQWILLGAHYDTMPATPGADDNASAVAVMLEASRLLRGYDGARSVRFVAFSCEEAPYFNLDSMGSQFHAKRARSRGEDIRGMLCLEMVGYFSREYGSQSVPRSIPGVFHSYFPRKGDFLASVGNLRSWRLAWEFRQGFRTGGDLSLFSIVLPEYIREIRLSDNSSFWDQGYPALMLTDTSFLRNPNYHQWTDTPDTLDYSSMVEVTLGVVAAIKRLLR